MLLRIVLFAMLTLCIAGVGAAAWFLLPGSNQVATAALPPPPVKIAVLVAAHPLRAGSLIKPEDLASQDVARADAPSGISMDTPQGRGALAGSMLRRTLGEGQPIMPQDVVHPGDHGFLAAVLSPDMRAVTVAVDAVSGTAGLIWPGDKVDVILTQTLDDPALAAGRRVAAQTVLSGARVIAIDQQLVQGQAPDGAAPPANRTATLEVTAAQAERVLVAGRLGHLSLSVLSSEKSNGDVAAPPQTAADLQAAPLQGGAAAAPPAATANGGTPRGSVTWASDVSPALGNGDGRTPPVMVHVYQGDADSKEFHF